MPPPRIATLARDPIFTFPPPVQKDVGGNGVSAAGFGYGFGAWGFMPGSSGLAVTPYGALQIAAVWSCVKRLAEDIGKLPRQILRRTGRLSQLSEGKKVDTKHPLNALLRRPNAWQTPIQCWGYLIAWFALRGNAYAVVLRGPDGAPEAIIPVNPDRVSVLMSPVSGLIYYQVSHPLIGDSVRFHRDDVIHIRSLISTDGYTGLSPIAAAQDVFGLGIATQQHGATLFRQGAQMNGIITHPGKLSADAKAFLSDNFERRQAGVQNAHKTPVFDEGMKFEKLTMTNEDAQFILSRQFSVEEIARMFGMPPHKIGDLSHAHFNNLEQSELAYRSDTLLPIGTQLREECGRVLFFEEEQLRYEMDVDYNELLRADRKTRYETDEIGIRSGRLTQNEARISDGREPNVPNGDVFQMPMNMGTTADAGSKPDPIVAGDEKPEPTAQGDGDS